MTHNHAVAGSNPAPAKSFLAKDVPAKVCLCCVNYRKAAFDKHEYPDVLEVHHKDEDRNNNNVTNLIILCPTYHMSRHYVRGTGKWARCT